MTLDINQANKILYQLDSDKFFNDIVKDEKTFLKICKTDPLLIRDMLLSHLPRLSKYQKMLIEKSKQPKVKQIHFSIRIEE